MAQGVLTDLEPEEAVALLSALVFQEKTENEPVGELVEYCTAKLLHFDFSCSC